MDDSLIASITAKMYRFSEVGVLLLLMFLPSLIYDSQLFSDTVKVVKGVKSYFTVQFFGALESDCRQHRYIALENYLYQTCVTMRPNTKFGLTHFSPVSHFYTPRKVF